MTSDRPVIWGMLAVVVGVWVAAALGLFGYGLMTLIIPTVVMLIAALVGAWQLDRGKRPIQADKYFDVNRANLDAPMTNQRWQVPTAYIDHPTGGGPPPGTELYDEGAVDDLLGEDRTLPGKDDIAP